MNNQMMDPTQHHGGNQNMMFPPTPAFNQQMLKDHQLAKQNDE